MCTQNVATPTIILNFRDQNSNHEIHEHMPRKFGAIRYFLPRFNYYEIGALAIAVINQIGAALWRYFHMHVTPIPGHATWRQMHR